MYVSFIVAYQPEFEKSFFLLILHFRFLFLLFEISDRMKDTYSK